MIVKTWTNPDSRNYLPPAPSGTVNACGETAPSDFNVQWACTREPGHEGDHAAHHDMGTLGGGAERDEDYLPPMIARWGR